MKEIHKMEPHRNIEAKKLDTKEFDLPETLLESNIDNSVFKGIILQCLSDVEGVALAEGTFIDNLLGRAKQEGMTGIQAEQDQANHSVKISLEIDVCYGVPIPHKAEEIQNKIIEEITRLTGVRVSAVHILFKHLIPSDPNKKLINSLESLMKAAPSSTKPMKNDEYTEEF